MNKTIALIERNIELSAEFSRYLFEHPDIDEKIPKEAEIVLIPDFDEELKEYNRELGKQIELEGGKCVYVSIKSLRPKTLSRIEGIRMEATS